MDDTTPYPWELRKMFVGFKVAMELEEFSSSLLVDESYASGCSDRQFKPLIPLHWSHNLALLTV